MITKKDTHKTQDPFSKGRGGGEEEVGILKPQTIFSSFFFQTKQLNAPFSSMPFFGTHFHGTGN